MRKQSFITGAMILMIANAVSKILGAVFKIPLTYILAEEGMAVYNTAFQIYIMFLSFIISGFPFAVSKAVAEAIAVKKPSRAWRIVNISTLMLSILGLLGMTALYFLAPYLAAAMKESGAELAIKIISPSVFFVALGTAYKSYFQGASDMVPVAMSQVIEAVVKLVVGYGLAVYCVKFGTLVTAAGAIGGVTVGEILATAMLMGGYLMVKKEKNIEKEDNTLIIKDLFSIAIPLLAVSVASDAMNMADTAVTRNSLLLSGLQEEEARFLYGAYTGYAQTVFHLPSGILATLGVSILPVIAGAVINDDMNRARRVTNFALQITMLMSLPCAVVMYMLPEELLNALFHNASSAPMLKLMAPCIVPVCVAQLVVSVMQSAGKIGTPFIMMTICSLLKIALCRYLTAMPELNIYGTIISSVACGFLMMILEYALLKKYFSLKLDFLAIIIKPAISAWVMALVVYLIREPVSAKLGCGFVSLFVISAASCAAYASALFLCGGVSIRQMRRVLSA